MQNISLKCLLTCVLCISIQVFSHFSYEFTRGKMMVVDIQGIGTLYTDPQIHTINGKG